VVPGGGRIAVKFDSRNFVKLFTSSTGLLPLRCCRSRAILSSFR